MKPIYALHKLSEGYIVTSNEQIEKGSIVLETLIDGKKELFEIHTLNDIDLERQVKVISQQDQIDFSALTEEQQKEIGYFDVVNFSQKHKDLQLKSGKDLSHSISSMYGFMDGFKTAQELLSDRRFTLEELEWAFMRGALINQRSHNGEILSFTTERTKDIQSLSQKSWKVELEVEKETLYTDDGLDYKGNLIPKLTNGKIKILKLCQNNLV
jgi:hypothetical protein